MRPGPRSRRRRGLCGRFAVNERDRIGKRLDAIEGMEDYDRERWAGADAVQYPCFTNIMSDQTRRPNADFLMRTCSFTKIEKGGTMSENCPACARMQLSMYS